VAGMTVEMGMMEPGGKGGTGGRTFSGKSDSDSDSNWIDNDSDSSGAASQTSRSRTSETDDSEREAIISSGIRFRRAVIHPSPIHHVPDQRRAQPA
jgi:hypothetical protein